MNIETITMPRAEATRKLEAYRRALARKANAEYEAAALGYEALAKGTPLLSLASAIARGGWDEKGRPRLAVARADQRRAFGKTNGEQLLFWSAPKASRWNSPDVRSTTLMRSFLLASMPARPATSDRWWSGQAIVPLIPPDVLPRVNADLSARYVLWEADWHEAPRDPMLLLPIGGDLYAVEAVWDLTELERAVIGRTRRAESA